MQIVEKRRYQTRTNTALNKKWSGGAKAVVLVAPTGAGKTLMLTQQVLAALEQDQRILWIVHRRELVNQAARVLQEVIGRDAVGIIMSGVAPSRERKIQVASIQTLLARKDIPPADLLVIDECHHIEADTYKALSQRYKRRRSRLLGGTATPERQDGRALGDTFSEMVVAASYSELIKDGYLVPCDVLRPASYLGMDLAQEPVSAYLKYGQNKRAFIFTRLIYDAIRIAKQLRRKGVLAESVEYATKKQIREDALAAFSAGKLKCLTNVYLLTEGVDVPAASACVLSRAFGFSGTMIQATGRILRPAHNKKRALVIDLTGCTHQHGFPDADREYSLIGRAITHQGPDVEGRGEQTNIQRVLGLNLHIESRWEPGKNVPVEAPLPQQVSEKQFLELEKIRERAKERRGTSRRAVQQLETRLREKFVRNS